MRRHVLGALAGLLSLTLVLAACGNEQGGGGTGGGTTASKIKLVAASYSEKTQGFWEDLIQRFEQQNAGTDVELQVIDSITNSTYRRLSRTVSTWKRSAARIPSACADRNCRHVRPARRGAGSMPARLSSSHTVLGATL
jgi:hypothetical protein